MYDLKTILLAKRIRRKLDVTRLSVADIALLEIIKNASDSNPVHNATIENGIATFGGVVASSPLVSLLLNIPVTQTGSGTPSPTNIRDFIGVSGVNIGQTSGYGEYFRGLLNGTYGFVDLGSLSYRRSTYQGVSYFITSISDIKNGVMMQTSNALCLLFTTVITQGVNSPQFVDNTMFVWTDGTIFFRDDDYTDAQTFTASLQGVYLIYELAEPSTPVTPQDFATLCQAFGITGNTYSISFGQTVYSAILDVLNGKLYLIDEIKTIDENSGVTRATTNVFYLPDFFNTENDTESINCNIYDRGENKSTGGGVVSNPDYSFCCRTTSNQLYIKDVRFNTITDYNDYLSNNPVKIAVKLAEPIEIDISPTVINTLVGNNVIFADVANVTECKYTRK